MITFKFVLKGTKNNLLRLRITNNRKVSEIALGVEMDSETLADALSDKTSTENLAVKSMITRWRADMEDLRNDLVRSGQANMDVSGIRRLVEKIILKKEIKDEADDENDKYSWEKYYEKYVESKTNRSYRTACDQTLVKMRKHFPQLSKMTFDDITLKWLRDLDTKMLEEDLSQNSRNIHFKNIRTCLNRAIDDELTNNYPFRRFKIRPAETRKRNLPVEEIRKLFDYPVEEYQKYYRDMFKLSFLLIGINPVDLAGLTEITSEGRIEYRRAKTKKLYSIKVEPEALALIKKYRGKKHLVSICDRWEDYQDFTKNCNIALKKIGAVERKGLGGKKEIISEWPDLSLYWARHSWATIARKIKVSKDDIAQALGHGKKTVTDVYIEEDRDAIDEANRRVIDWVLYGKR